MTGLGHRRVVSGRTPGGRWGVLDDGRADIIESHQVQGEPFDVVHIWNATSASLETADHTREANLGDIFGLPPGSSRFFVESMAPTGSPSGWHRTNTIDYEYIISGRIDLLLEDGSAVTLEAGDVNIQLGGMHQWWNRYEDPCILLIVMVAVPSDELPGVAAPTGAD